MPTRRLLASLLALSLSACGPEGGSAESDEGSGVGHDDAEVVAACGPRVAVTGVTASTSDDNLPSGAVDGNAATRWSGLGVGAFLTADLGSVKALCGVSLQWYRGAERSNRFVISVSTDGSTFKQVFAGTSILAAATQNYAVTASSARYVRVTVNGNSQNSWASINEFQVNAAVPVTPAPGTPGSYKPSAANTGVRPGTTLKPHNTGGQDLVITQDGTVLENLDVYGDIKVRARNVIIRNSRLRGGKGIPGSNTGIVDANSAAVVNLLVEDCTLTPDRPSYYRDGIVGHDYTARRNHISRTNDGLGIFNRKDTSLNANVRVEANYIHTLTYWSNDPAHDDGTHNDCIQIQGGQNIQIVGNTIKCDAVTGAGSAPSPRGPHAGQGILVQQNVSPTGNINIEKNWLDDSAASLKISHSPEKGRTQITVTVRDNKFGRNQYDYNMNSRYPLRIFDASACNVLGVNRPSNTTNRWEDNGVLLQEGRDLGIRTDQP